jgi:ribose transport system permease protein
MRPKLNLGFDRFSGIYLWIAFIAVFAFLSPNQFWSVTTIQVIASQQAVAGMIALALLVPMVCGQFDLSVGAIANLCGLIAVALQNSGHYGVLSAVGIAALIGMAIGAVNGFIVVKLHVSSFIATLGMGSILVAIQAMVTHSETPISPSSALWTNMTQTSIFGFQIVIVYLLILAIVIWWFLSLTPAGRYMYASGSNAEATRLAGLLPHRWAWFSLVISGGISAVAGVMYCSLTFPSLAFGNALLLPAFAAVFLGSTQLSPGRFNVWGTLLAIGVLATGATGLQLVTGIQWIQDMFNGVALIIAVALSTQRARFTGFRRRPPTEVPDERKDEKASTDDVQPARSSASVN